MWNCVFYRAAQHPAYRWYTASLWVSVLSLRRSTLPAHTKTCHCYIGLKLFQFLYRGSKNCRILYCPAHLKCLIFLLSQMMDCFLTPTSLLYTPQNVLKLMTSTFIKIKRSMINLFLQLRRRMFFWTLHSERGRTILMSSRILIHLE